MALSFLDATCHGIRTPAWGSLRINLVNILTEREAMCP